MTNGEFKQLALGAFEFRHACKEFDKLKKIPDGDFDFLLEAARLSPSSFGLEAWRIVAVEDGALRKKLRDACWDQKQITSASHLAVFITKKRSVFQDNKDWLKENFERRGLNIIATKARVDKFLDFLENNHKDTENEWSKRQCYIPMTNMITMAAFLGIDSCPIEGFEAEKIEEILDINQQREEVALLCAFGYRLHEQSQKVRRSKEEIITWI